MRRKSTQQRPMPVLAVVRNPDPHVCAQCTSRHGAPGSRCERHHMYIERLPTEEERSDADRERDANRDPKVALAKIMSMLDIDEDDVEYEGIDPVACVGELISMRDKIDNCFPDFDKMPADELSALVQTTVEERDAAFKAIDEHLGAEPDNKDDVEKIVSEFASASIERDTFDELLRLLGMTENEYELTSGNFPIMSSSEFLLARLRVVLPEILQQPVTVIEPPKKRRR